MALSRGKLLAVGLVLLTLIGFVFLRGPIPHIVIKPETIASAGSIDLTNTMITSWLVVATMVVTVFFATRRWEIVPRGVQNVVEAIVEGFYNLVVNIAGEKNGRRFFPVVATIFFFVLASNWLSLLPIFSVIGKFEEQEHGFVVEQQSVGSIDFSYVPFSQVPSKWSADTIDEDDPNAHEQYQKAKSEGKSVGELLPFFRGPNTDVNTPLALAIVSAIAVETWAITSLGLFTYGRKFIRAGTFFRGLIRFKPGMVFTGMIDGFVGFLEFVSEVVRLLSFTARLFGNMFAGEVVLVMFTFLTPVVITIAFYGLELFVGVIQALVFAMLTLVFGVMAVTHAEAHGSAEKHESLPHEEGVAEAGLQEAV